jgi:hypothetical protein
MVKTILFSIALATCYLNAVAQDNNNTVDSTQAVNWKPDFRPTGIRFGVDVIGPIKSFRQSNFNGWEVSSDVDLHRYLLTVDYGNWGRNFSADSANFISHYSNTGTYWRVGIDVNFLTRDQERNVFFLGARYGHANYSEKTSFTAFDNNFGQVSGSYFNNNILAHWVELTMGLKVKVYKFIWLGYTGRLKFGLKTHEKGMLSSDVPGYGRTNKDNTFGFNYYVYFRIPFRKAGSILPPQKK